MEITSNNTHPCSGIAFGEALRAGDTPRTPADVATRPWRTLRLRAAGPGPTCAREYVDGKSVPYLSSVTTLPGLRMFLGSNAALMPRISARTSDESDSAR